MKKIHRAGICRTFCLTAVLWIICVSIPVYINAAEKPNEKKPNIEKQIVFVLDASGSMKTNDTNRLAIDSIAQLIYSLPSDYQVGFIAYNSEITASKDFVSSAQRRQIMEEAEQVQYLGYSNAGAGLSSAVGMFSESTADEKDIVLLSDGEVLLDEEARTALSKEQYRQAVEQAVQENIHIHVIGLGDEMQDMNNFIFSAAERTDGSSFYTPQALKIQGAIDTVLTEELKIKQSTIAMIDADGGTEQISAELPYAYADKVRVLLTSTAPIANLTANFQADSANQVNGSRYSLIEIEHPADAKLELSFVGTEGNQVRVNIIPEYCVFMQAEVSYTDEVPADAERFSYDRTALIKYSFYDAKNPDIQLWTEKFFDYTKISVTENANIQELSLNQGFLETKVSLEKAETFSIVPNYAQMPVNVIAYGNLSIELEEPPLLPAEEPQPPYTMIILAVIFFIVLTTFLVAWWRGRKKPIPEPPEDKPEPSKYSYVGKLNLYITRTQSGYDVPPLSFQLLRLPAGRVISMKEILENCGVKEEFPGADMIYFKPGANRNLIFTNNSDCTIMKNREILMKKKSYQLSADAKVDITFEDEISELMFQYKELKPSAM